MINSLRMTNVNMTYKTCSLCGKNSNSKYCSECINRLIRERKATITKNIRKQSGLLIICGKGGQGIRVCDGGPFIRIDDITIGGLN